MKWKALAACALASLVMVATGCGGKSSNDAAKAEAG